MARQAQRDDGGRTVDVLVVGSANVDHTVTVDRHPQPGETVLGSDASVAPGGKGANVAVAVGRLGARVGLLGAVGDDAEGRLLVAALTDAAVDVGMLRHSVAPTGAAHITVSADGENAIVVSPGANAQVVPGDVDAASATFRTARVLFAVLEVPLPVVRHGAAVAAANGVRVVLNASPVPAEALSDELLRASDPLVVNAAEAAALLATHGVATVDGGNHVDDGARLAESLLALGVRSAVVTSGVEGAAVATDAGVHTVGAPRVDVVDTTGAGDAFSGSLCHGLARGAALSDAVADAVVVASDSVTRRGAQTVSS